MFFARIGHLESFSQMKKKYIVLIGLLFASFINYLYLINYLDF